mgnify:FL=1
MSNSRRKMNVTVTDTPWGKKWARVELVKGSTFYPSFEDLHRMIQAICHCEDLKYPNQKGRAMVAEFLTQAVWEKDFEKLAAMFKIPRRCGATVVNSNGANLNGGSDKESNT